MNKRQVYDCFTFFNELELLEIRLNTLDKYVDKFVLVEATLTFSGNPKPLYYNENKERFSKFNDRIIHIIVDQYLDSKDSWVLETNQRNQISRGLTDCHPDDVVIISDADEIPNPQVVKNKKGPGIQSLQQKLYHCYLNGHINDTWLLPKIMLKSDMLNSLDHRDDLYSRYLPALNNKGTTPSKIRMCGAPKIDNGGWHFGYLGGIDKIRYKIESYSHQENNTEEYKKLENLNKLVENIKYVKIDNTFPEYIESNQGKYSALIYPVE